MNLSKVYNQSLETNVDIKLYDVNLDCSRCVESLIKEKKVKNLRKKTDKLRIYTLIV